MTRFALLISLCIFRISVIWPQEPFMFHYSVKDGLPSKEVHYIFEDSKGYIWICTDAGIAKYNANTFKIFDSSDGLPDNTVFEVLEDKHHRIWYRTFTGGVGYILNDSVYSIKANTKIIALQNKGLISSFLMKDDTLMLGLQSFKECFFIKLNPPYTEENLKKVTSPFVSSSGMDVIIFDKRVLFSENRFANLTKEKKVAFFKTVIRNNDGEVLFSDSVDSRETDGLSKFYFNNANLILTNKSKVIFYNLRTKNKRTEIYNRNILCGLPDGGKLLLGFRKDGVREYFSDHANESSYYLDGKSVSSIQKDSRGGYWFGTLEDGVHYCPNKNYYKVNIFKDQKEKSEIVYLHKVADTSLLAITKNGRVYSVRFHDLVSSIKLLHSFKKNGVITSIKVVNNSKLFVEYSSENYSHEISIPTKNTAAKEKILPFVFKDITRLGNNYMILSPQTVFFTDTLDFAISRKIEFNDRLNSLAYNSVLKEIYVCGRRGLYKVNLKDTSNSYSVLFDTRTEDIQLAGGELFIATKTKGMFIQSEKGYDTITVKNGLLSNVCKKLFYLKNEMWVLTNLGFSRINYRAYKDYTVKNYPFTEYLFPEAIDNIIQVKDRLIFYEGTNIYFYPALNEKTDHVFRIANVKANDIRLTGLNNINLEYNQNNISVNYEALFFSRNRQIYYRYKFEGIDSIWHFTTRSNITFPSLSPGKYKLILQAQNDDNDWINCESELLFSIGKPLWKKWWFVFSEIIFATALVLILVYYRYKSILEKERARNQMNKRLHELEIKVVKAQMNPHFISNCLAAIQELIYNNDIDKAGQYIAKFSLFIRQVLHYSDQTFITLKEELEIIKLNIELEQLRFEVDLDFTINISSDVKAEDVMIPSLISQPFIENAIWHGLLPLKKDRKPKLILNIYLKNNLLYLEIEDNGVGRNRNQNKNGRVSKGTRLVIDKLENINKLKGSNQYKMEIIDLKDKEGEPKGTKIIIQLINYND